MRDSLKILCDGFLQNRENIKVHLKGGYGFLNPVCSAMLASKGLFPTPETLLKCRDILRSHAGIFSNLRGNITLPVITMLASSDAPEEKLRKILDIYEILKKYFSKNEFLAYGAAVLSDTIETSEADSVAQRAKTIYKLMKKEHPMITSVEDCVFALLMALSPQSDSELIKDMEICYGILKPVFSYGNYVQAMSHVITLAGGDVRESCQKAMAIYATLCNAGRQYGRYNELSVLAALAVLPVDIQKVSEDILEVDAFLAKQKGYGFWGMDKRTRLMHAAVLVSCDYSQNVAMSAAAVSTTVALFAAQQAAICAAVAASSAAIAVSNNSN